MSRANLDSHTDPPVLPAPIVVVLVRNRSCGEWAIWNAATSVRGRPGLAVRIEIRTHDAFLRGAGMDPPPLVGGVLIVGDASNVVARAKRWNVPYLPTRGSGEELFLVARDWMTAFAFEIASGPRLRAEQAALSAPFRRYSLQAWEMLDPHEQDARAHRIGLVRREIDIALLSDASFRRLGAGERLVLASILGLWDTKRLRLVPPAPPSGLFTTEELEALDRASLQERWSKADRAFAMQLGIEAKAQARLDRQIERRNAEVENDEALLVYRAVESELRTAPRWVALMEHGDAPRT